MTDFLKTIEILIDQLILHLPSEWFVEAPFLAVLLSNPNGRYILTGILMVTGLIVLWVIILSVQVLSGGRLGKSKPTVLQNADEQTKLVATAELDGFKFFKRKSTSGLVANNEAILRKIEKEMRNSWFLAETSCIFLAFEAKMKTPPALERGRPS